MSFSMLGFRAGMIAIVVLIWVMALPFASLANILGSKHDLSVGKGAALNYNFVYANNNHVCVYCHTPHDPGTSNGGKPQWDRTFSAATFTLYNSPAPEQAASQLTSTASYSLICLSCHDGTIAMDSLANMLNQPRTKDSNLRGYTASPAMQSTILGAEMSKDHPVGVAYDNTTNPALNPENTIAVAGLKLFDGKVECPTCHDPHNNSNSAFTRVANAQSGLCMTCHLK